MSQPPAGTAKPTADSPDPDQLAPTDASEPGEVTGLAAERAGQPSILLRSALVAVLPATAALLAGISVPAREPTWAVPGLLLVLATLVVVVRPVRMLAGRQWVLRALGTNSLARVLMALAVTGFFVDNRLFGDAPGGDPLTLADDGMASLAAVLVIGGVLSERVVARLRGTWFPYLARLPGVAPVPIVRPRAAAVLGASLGALFAGLLLAALGGPGWVWTLVCLVSLAPLALTAFEAVARIRYGRTVNAAVAQAVAGYAPEFAVYTARPDAAAYQVAMWLPYLHRAGRRFMIIARTNAAAAAIAESMPAELDVPIVVRRDIADLDGVVPDSLRVVFYVNASSGNNAFIRYRQLSHVYLGHGDSDKPPSYNPTHAMYDRIFAAGPAAVRRYAEHGVRIPADRFEIVGRPQVESVQPAAGPISGVPEPLVLYAPTWRGHVSETNFYSIPRGPDIVRALIDRGATVIFRPHPFNYTFVEDAETCEQIKAMLFEAGRRTGRRHVFGAAAETERDILDCINDSDAMISDVSSVVSDYLQSAKPFGMVAVPAPAEAFVRDYPVARGSYVIDGDLGNLEPVLDDLLGADSMAANREQIRVDYLGDFGPQAVGSAYAEVFVGSCQRMIIDHPTQAADVPESAADQGTAEADTEPEAGGDSTEETSYRQAGRQLLVLVRDIVATLTCSIAALLLLTQFVLAGFVLTGLALLLLLAMHRRAIRSPGALGRTLGRSVSARTALALGLAWGWLGAVPAGPVPVAAALITGTLVVPLALEGDLRNGWNRASLQTWQLPGVPEELPGSAVRRALPVTSTAALVFGWLSLIPIMIGAFGSTGDGIGVGDARPSGLTLVGGGFLALAGLCTLLTLGSAVVLRARIWRRITIALTAQRDTPAALRRYQPAFVAYFASTVGLDYQLGMWLPYFERIGLPYVVLCRTAAMARMAREVSDRPVLFCSTLRAVEEAVVPSMRAVFYVNNAVKNTHMVERRELTHVWLNHGDSEKPACFNPVHAIYDLIFAAGQAGIDRYARHGVQIPAEKFRIVGRPQTERIEPANRPVETIDQPTVLYAPTWRGPYADTMVYSLPRGAEIVQALLDRGVRVIFRAHPFNYRYPDATRMIRSIETLLAEDRRRTGRQHLSGKAAEQDLSFVDCFNASDAMISDISAMVSDYLQSTKPFAVATVGRSVGQLYTEMPAARGGYPLTEELTNIAEVLDHLLGSDPLRTERVAIRDYYLGDFPRDRYADGFLSAARAVIAAEPPSHFLDPVR